MDNSAVHILTDEQLVKMAQEGSETAEEILIEKYKSLAKGKAQIFFLRLSAVTIRTEMQHFAPMPIYA